MWKWDNTEISSQRKHLPSLGHIYLPWGTKEEWELASQGCLAALGTPVTYLRGSWSQKKMQPCPRCHQKQGDRGRNKLAFLFFCPLSLLLVPHWLKLPGKGHGSLGNVVPCKQSRPRRVKHGSEIPISNWSNNQTQAVDQDKWIIAGYYFWMKLRNLQSKRRSFYPSFEVEAGAHTDPCTSKFTALFTLAKSRNNPNIYQYMIGRMGCVCDRISFSHQKEHDSDKC